MLTREALLGMRRSVIVPVAGGQVRLQAPTAGVWLDYQAWLTALPEQSLDYLTRLIAITAVDEDGKPLLTDEDCRQLDHSTMTTLARAAIDLTKSEVGAKQGES
jgi:hypothetical protein